MVEGNCPKLRRAMVEKHLRMVVKLLSIRLAMDAVRKLLQEDILQFNSEDNLLEESHPYRLVMEHHLVAQLLLHRDVIPDPLVVLVERRVHPQAHHLPVDPPVQLQDLILDQILQLHRDRLVLDPLL